VLVFLSPWCESYLSSTRPQVAGACRAAREQVASLAPGSHARWLGVASGLWATQDDLAKYQKNYGVHIPLTLDDSGTMFREFRVNDVPTVIVADAQGRVLRRVEPGESSELRAVLQGLM
jgi:hypothetical protein